MNAYDDAEFRKVVSMFATRHQVAEDKLWPLLECAFGFGAVAAFGESISVVRASSVEIAAVAKKALGIVNT